MAIDYDAFGREAAKVLGEEVRKFGDATAPNAKLLEQLAKDAAGYWAKSVLGDEDAESELAHIRATAILIGANLALEAQVRVRETLEVILKIGLAALKTLL